MAVAESTVALTLYNILATHKSPLSRAALVRHPILTDQFSGSVTPVGAGSALDQLIHRGWVRQSEKVCSLADPLMRLCTTRNRDGDGWDGWKLQNQNGRTPIEEAGK